MRHAPVEDDRRLDPAIDRVEAGLDLGDHAAGDDAVGDHPPRRAGGDLGQQPFVGVEHARDIGQQQTAASP